MNLEEVILQAVGKVIESGAIEAAIEKQIEATITEVLKDKLRAYSDFGRSIEAAVKKSLAIGDLDLPSYNETILKIIQAKVRGLTEKSIQKQVADQMEKLLTPAPESITLSALVDQYKEFVKDRQRYDCTCHTSAKITCEVQESDRGWKYIHLDEEAQKNRHQCGIRIGTHNGEIFSLNMHGADAKELFSGPFYGFERMLFQMKAAKAKLVFDVDPSELDLEYELVEQ